MENTVNDRIIALLKSKNLGDSDLAELIGRDRSTVNRITTKKAVPHKSTVKLIAGALGVDFQALYYGENVALSVAYSDSDQVSVLRQQLAKKDEQIKNLMFQIQELLSMLKGGENFCKVLELKTLSFTDEVLEPTGT